MATKAFEFIVARSIQSGNKPRLVSGILLEHQIPDIDSEYFIDAMENAHVNDGMHVTVAEDNNCEHDRIIRGYVFAGSWMIAENTMREWLKDF